MSDETPPWEIPDSLIEEINEFSVRQKAITERILSAPYVASDHMPVWDYIEDEDDAPSFLGCSCQIPGIGSTDDWGPHVDELQRRDRARVWQQGAVASDERSAVVVAEDNPYTKEN